MIGRWAIVVALVSAVLAPVAMANKPDRQVLPGADEVVPPGLACPGAVAPEGVHVRSLGPTSVVRTWDDGRALLSGRHPDEFTNVATGKSIILRLQGSAAFVPQADGSVKGRLSGRTVYIFFPGEVGPGDDATGRTYVFTGNVRLVLDASGAVVGFSSSGKMDDVCAMIA
jgi:hypothetical protein